MEFQFHYPPPTGIGARRSVYVAPSNTTMSWMEFEDILEGDGHYALALVEDEADLELVRAKEDHRKKTTMKRRIKEMRNWLAEPQVGGRLPVEEAGTQARIAARIESISSMRAYMGGGMTQQDIAESESIDESDLAVMEIAATADGQNMGVRHYIEALSAAIDGKRSS